MSNLHLVTGYAGQAHVTAADDGSFNRAIFGGGQYVFDIGSKLAASVVSNNKITIADGDLLMQGRHVRLNEGTTIDLTINNGTQGKLRNDLIVARYTKDSISGVEEVNLVVIQGTAVDSDPADPEYTSGDIINDHALLNDMPLYRVPLDGLTVGTPIALFSLAAVQISDGAVTGDMLSDDVDALLLGGISITKLWENANPSSSFPEQTISVPTLANCPLIVVVVRWYDGTELSAIIRDGQKYGMSAMFDGRIWRYVTYSSLGGYIKFSGGYYTNSPGNTIAANDNCAVPIVVYGIKGVK